MSSLRLATGIQSVTGGDIGVIDTESGRALKYADYFKFNHVPFLPPYRSLDYLAVCEFAKNKGAKTIIVDSATHEHAGIGGYLEYADAELDRMAGDDWKRRQAMKLASFAKPATDRRKMIDGLLALGVNLIFNFRAKDKVKPMKNEQGKTEIEHLGFMPIGAPELVFEMDACCLLMPAAGGVPTWLSDEIGEKMMIKPAMQFETIFRERKPLDESIGKQLAEWAIGVAPSGSTKKPDLGPNAAIVDQIKKALSTACKDVPKDEKAAKMAEMSTKYFKVGSSEELAKLPAADLENGLLNLKGSEGLL